MQNRFYLVLFTVLCGLTLASCDLRATPDGENSSSASSVRSISSSSVSSIASVTSSRSTASVPTETPASHKLDVPFTSQAPLANWTDKLNEACEEASLLSVEYYLRGEALPAPAQTEKLLYDMISWEEQNGYEWDMTAQEVADMAEKYFKRNATVYTGKDVTAQKIKSLIAAGHPVIIPAAGQMLGNPYFSGDGPPYHMLVITGYDSRGFITNDVGTRRGEDYRYSETTIMNAIHDWTGDKETITSGQKAILIVE